MGGICRRGIVCLGLAALVPAVQAAAVFDFQYSFGNGHQVSGSFSGNLNDNGTAGDASDDFVQDITGISAAIDGQAFNGATLYFNQYVDGGWPVQDGTYRAAKVHFSMSLNNWLLSAFDSYNAAVQQSQANPSQYEYFMIRQSDTGNVCRNYYHGPVAPAGATNFVDTCSSGAGTWQLAQHSDGGGSVPEPGVMALAGLALLAARTTSRRPRA